MNREQQKVNQEQAVVNEEQDSVNQMRPALRPRSKKPSRQSSIPPGEGAWPARFTSGPAPRQFRAGVREGGARGPHSR